MPLTDIHPSRWSRGLCLHRLLQVGREHKLPLSTLSESACLGADSAGLGFPPSPQQLLLQNCWGMTRLLSFQGPTLVFSSHHPTLRFPQHFTLLCSCAALPLVPLLCSGRLFFYPSACPAQSQAVKSLPQYFLFSGIWQALLHSFFCPFHDFLFFPFYYCSYLLLFPAVVSWGFLHQKLPQYLGNSSVPGV